MTVPFRVRVILVVLACVVVACLLLVGAWMVTQTNRSVRLEREGAADRRVLIECLTPPSPPGVSADPDDRVHECLDESERRRGNAVDEIERRAWALAECEREGAPDLAACATRKAPR